MSVEPIHLQIMVTGDLPSKPENQYKPSFRTFQANSPRISAQLSGLFDTAAKSPVPTSEAALCSPASSTVLNTTAATNFAASTPLCVDSPCFETSTTGGVIVERDERGLRAAAGDPDFALVVAGASISPLTALAGMLPPLLEPMLADFECRLRDAMLSLVMLRAQDAGRLGSCSGWMSVVVRSRSSSVEDHAATAQRQETS